MGVTDQGAYTNIYVGPRAQFKEEPLLDLTDQGAHTNIYVGLRAQSKEEPLLGQVWLRTKGTAYY